MIADAETVHVAGFRRSFPVAAYLAYSLQQAGKRMQFIDGVAGLALGHGPSIGSDDLLIAISYHPYAEETVQDRKSVVKGKSVSVRVDLGGRRIIKNKNMKQLGLIKSCTQ